MKLFGFNRKQEKTKAENENCSCSCSASETEVTERETACCCGGTETIRSIRVLGSGCASCHALLENTRKAVKAMNLPAEAEYVTDMSEIIKYGVMSFPALVVNERVISAGKTLKAGDVEKLLKKQGF